MSARRVDPSGGAPPTPSMLEQLLAAERRAADALVAADADAARLIEEARAEAAADDERAARSLEAELARMRSDAETERAAAVDAIAGGAAERAARYDRTDADPIARRIVALILRGPAADGGEDGR